MILFVNCADVVWTFVAIVLYVSNRHVESNCVRSYGTI